MKIMEIVSYMLKLFIIMADVHYQNQQIDCARRGPDLKPDGPFKFKATFKL